jgi:hypothetical protein
MTKKIGAKALKPNPALKFFEPLVGEWQKDLSLTYEKL